MGSRNILNQDSSLWFGYYPSPAFILDFQSIVREINPDAERIAAAGSFLTVDKGGRFATSDPADRKMLEGVLGRYVPRAPPRKSTLGPSLVRVKHRAERDIFLHFTPLGPLLLVTVIDPDAPLLMSAAELAACLAITEAEARIVGLLCEGSTLRISAAKLNVSYTTARNQLASACAKTGLHTQLQLVRYAMAILVRIPITLSV